MIYVIECGEHVKVGYSKRSGQSRLGGMLEATANFPPLTEAGVVAEFEGTLAQELAFHRAMREKGAKSAGGEWYRADVAEVLAMLQQVLPALYGAGCVEHGSGHMAPARPSWARRGLRGQCGECDREYHRQYRQTHKPWLKEDVKEKTREYVRNHRARKKEAS